ncbi:MAG TPA: MFS transporter [Thermoanaerobaculia bacterium]|nr:MFS transporter [Thermoanaerobaculia bacterium]
MNGVARGPCDEGILHSAEFSACDPATARWVFAATILGSSMAFIDGTVVNIALPVLQTSLQASVSSAQWVVEAYALSLSALVLAGGSLGDRVGRRRVFAIGVTVFALSSAVCGLAPDVWSLVAARALQGVGAALLVPSSLAILGAAFSPLERGRAVGTWSALTAVSAAVGPILGGWLVQVASWRAVFFLNLPIAAAVLAIALRKIPETRNPSVAPLDLAGALFATVGLGTVVFGLIEAPAAGWSNPRVWGCLAAGGAALAAFAVVERTSSHPMVPLELFRIRAFAGANLLTLFLYAALSATMFLLPFDLIQAQGYSPTAAGLAFLPLIVLLSALSRPAGAIADRFGSRLPLTAGPAIAAVGFVLLAVPGEGARYATAFLPALGVLGLGMAMTVAPLTTAVLNAVNPGQAGAASGINNAVARVAGLLAIAALGIVASHVFDGALDRHLAQAGLSSVARKIPHAEREKLGAARAPAGLSEAETRQVQRAIAASLVASFRVSMGIAAALALLAAATGALLAGSRHASAGAPPL